MDGQTEATDAGVAVATQPVDAAADAANVPAADDPNGWQQMGVPALRSQINERVPTLKGQLTYAKKPELIRVLEAADAGGAALDAVTNELLPELQKRERASKAKQTRKRNAQAKQSEVEAPAADAESKAKANTASTKNVLSALRGVRVLLANGHVDTAILVIDGLEVTLGR